MGTRRRTASSRRFATDLLAASASALAAIVAEELLARTGARQLSPA